MLGLGGEIADAAAEAGLPFVREAFLDRAYTAGGCARSARASRGPCCIPPTPSPPARVRLVREGVIEAIDGTLVEADAASLCVHGDTPEAVAMARAVRAALEREGVVIRAPWGARQQAGAWGAAPEGMTAARVGTQ